MRINSLFSDIKKVLGLCSNDQKSYQAMNEIAKSGTSFVDRTFPRASSEDLDKLMHGEYAIYKNYFLLKNGLGEDPKLARIRALNAQNGEYIKVCDVQKNSIAIIDDFSGPDIDYRGLNITHGDIVSIQAKKINPFSNTHTIDCSTKDLNGTYYPHAGKINEILKEMKTFKPSHINISLGQEYNYVDEYSKCKNVVPEIDLKTFFVHLLNNFKKNYPFIDQFGKISKQLTDKNIKIFCAGGNKGENFLTPYLLFSHIEGVSSLNFGQNVASKPFVKHFEHTKYPVVITKEGINITGGQNIDIKFPSSYTFLNKTIKDVMTPKEVKLLARISKNVSEGRCNLEELQMIERQLGKKIIKPEDARMITGDNANTEVGEAYLDLETSVRVILGEKGTFVPVLPKNIDGSSLASAKRTARVALYDMLKGYLN